MRSKSIVLLVLALGCGLVASIGISQVMDARNTPVEHGEKEAIFVALADISPNEQLTAQNIKLEEFPKNLVPTGAITKLEELEEKRAKIKLYAGEVILGNKLLGEGEMMGAATQIPSGYRVAYVKVDSNTGSSNLIMPGDRVDVLVFRNTGNDLSTTAATIMLQDVRVFAVDTQTEHETRTRGEVTEPTTARTISLLVTPDQAVILHMASEISGSVRLVLRNPDDDTHVKTPTASLGDIFGPEIRSNRESEQLTQNDTGSKTGGLGNWLDQVKQSLPTVQEPAAPPLPQKRMTLILGPEVKFIDFPLDGEPPVTPLYEPENSSGSFVPDSEQSSFPTDWPAEDSFSN